MLLYGRGKGLALCEGQWRLKSASGMAAKGGSRLAAPTGPAGRQPGEVRNAALVAEGEATKQLFNNSDASITRALSHSRLHYNYHN